MSISSTRHKQKYNIRYRITIYEHWCTVYSSRQRQWETSYEQSHAFREIHQLLVHPKDKIDLEQKMLTSFMRSRASLTAKHTMARRAEPEGREEENIKKKLCEKETTRNHQSHFKKERERGKLRSGMEPEMSHQKATTAVAELSWNEEAGILLCGKPERRGQTYNPAPADAIFKNSTEGNAGSRRLARSTCGTAPRLRFLRKARNLNWESLNHSDQL